MEQLISRTRYIPESYAYRIKNFVYEDYRPAKKEIRVNKPPYQKYTKTNKYNEINLNNKTIVKITREFTELYEEIESSKYILDTHIDEENENSEKYDSETWTRAIEFIAAFAKFIYEEQARIIDTPEIIDGPDGSIDILWRKPDRRLLINIPNDENGQISFYGDNLKSKKIEAEFPKEDFDSGIKFSLYSILCGK